MRFPRGTARWIGFVLLMVMVAGLAIPPSMGDGMDADSGLGEPEEASVVRIEVPDREAMNGLLRDGVDLAEYLQETSGGIQLDAVVTPSELEELAARPEVEVIETLFTRKDWEERLEERKETVVREQRVSVMAVDQVTILRAEWFQNDTGTFLSLEAKTDAGIRPDVALTAQWNAGEGTTIDAGGTATMQRFVDAGQYLYHRMLVPVENVPTRVKVSSNEGGEVTGSVSQWLGGKKPNPENPHYVKDFISHYMTPTEIDQRLEAVVAEFPEIAEIVELPNQTEGYRRKSQVIVGSRAESAVVVTSKVWGHEGGNDWAIEVKDPGKPNQELSMDVAKRRITVELATDASGVPVTTAAQLVEALNRDAGDVIKAHLYRGNPGAGVVQPQGLTQLDNHLNAPDSVSREPFTVKAVRIGKHRDGSRLGVLAYSQEHAREWVTPLVSVETIERLLRNYAHDKETRRLVDNLDIFIIPTVNPDGAHYSFYDYNMQRKNMRNDCDEGSADPGYRNRWGIDINRNYAEGSLFDGYTGGSSNCLSDVYSGRSELSEHESRNVIELANQNPNITFAMNIHSYGGYFMWSPGAYKANGRETLPRPTLGEEAFFWGSSERILSAIQEHRGTVIQPGRTGPVADVLYSAAGNSADHLWYQNDIFAWNFEVGADRWNPEMKRWEPVGFQPAFEEGHAEAMEFSNGLIEMMRVALDFNKDKKPPRSHVTPKPGRYKKSVEVQFQVNEPATIFYTTDGSRPTFDSPRYQSSGVREGGETLTFNRTTELKWFAVDAAGNIERNYNPNGKKHNYRRATFTIR
ncbi:M14 family metallopeptidase [Desmospora profundinema]|uniref:Peptidase M14 domain-containing protein n=1 Tax=Desmospora profundinema TaxID=1571184 RepID=A0ABU1IMH9_9BACL|nr:M14 family metallopeptidase [Desmospora profundinema]MDR6225164.1 hypothetical protein [Desmospora profundinema]